MATGRHTHIAAIHFVVLLCHVMLGQTLRSDVIHSTPPACTVSHGVGGPEAACTGDSVTVIPSSLSPLLVKLKITNTSLAVLEKGALSHLTRLVNLDLSGNLLTRMKPGCFRGLTALRYISIANNRLCFGDDAFPVNVFDGVTSLRTLTMHSNVCPSGHVGYPDRALGELSGLETLAMNGLPNVPLGPGFARMTSLKSLELSGKHCHLDVLSRRTFTSLENTSLSSLSLRACDVSRFDRHALTPLSSLATLNLACNERVGLKNAVAAVGAATTTRLDTFILDNVNAKKALLDRVMFESTTFRSVRRFSFRANKLLAADVRALKHFPMVRDVALGYNIWTKILPSDNFVEILMTLTGNMTLDVVDVGDLMSSPSKYQRLFCDPDHVDNDAFFRDKPRLHGVNFSRRAKPAGYRHGSVDDIPFFTLAFFADNAHYESKSFTLPELKANVYSDVVVINMSSTKMTELKGPLIGFNNLQVYDVSHCRIHKIHPGALIQLRNLKYLFLQYNVIGENGDAIAGQFHGLSALFQLDLSHNRITAVERDAFRDLARLRYLNLRGNELTALGFDVSHLAVGVSVDVSSNPVVSSKRDVAGECKLWEEGTEGKLTDVTLVCDCSNVTYIYWRQSAGVGESLPCVNASREDAEAGSIDRARSGSLSARVNVVVVAIAVVVVVVVVVVVIVSVAVAWWVFSQRRHSGGNVLYSSVKAVT